MRPLPMQSLRDLYGASYILYFKAAATCPTSNLPDIALVRPSFTPFGIRAITEAKIVAKNRSTIYPYKNLEEWENDPDTERLEKVSITSDADGFYLTPPLGSRRKGIQGVIDRLQKKTVYEFTIDLATQDSQNTVANVTVTFARRERSWNHLGHGIDLQVSQS